MIETPHARGVTVTKYSNIHFGKINQRSNKSYHFAGPTQTAESNHSSPRNLKD